jgi:hypothetical protein
VSLVTVEFIAKVGFSWIQIHVCTDLWKEIDKGYVDRKANGDTTNNSSYDACIKWNRHINNWYLQSCKDVTIGHLNILYSNVANAPRAASS